MYVHVHIVIDSLLHCDTETNSMLSKIIFQCFSIIEIFCILYTCTLHVFDLDKCTKSNRKQSNREIANIGDI